MQTRVFRLPSIACWVMCYLLLGAAAAGAQTPQCVTQENGLPPPANCHVVTVGPGGQTQFRDGDSGFESGGIGNNAVVTVIRVGHAVQWQFEYTHSSTSGTCDAPIPGICTPNGQWDSTIKGTGTHTVVFSQVGVFTFFCGVHFAAMRGMVVVLDDPDYNLFAADPTFVSSLTATPTLTIFAGGSGNFVGQVISYLNFSTNLSLTCANGDPRLPSSCPTTPTSVTPGTNPPNQPFAVTPVIFPVSEATGGEYSFDVVATLAGGLPQPSPSPFTHRKRVLLRVNDLGLTPPQGLTAYRGDTNVQVTVPAKSIGTFSGNVTTSCGVAPAGLTCQVSPSSFTLPAGGTQNLTVTFPSGTLIAPNNYTVTVTASSSATDPGPGAFSRNKDFNVALKPAEQFAVNPIGSITNITPGTSFPVLIEALGPTSARQTNYTGTVEFSSTDSLATVDGQALPATFTFGVANSGAKIFNIVFNSVGPRTIVITDTTVFETTGSSPMIRVEGDEPDDNDIALTSNRAPAKDAYFRNDNVTFTATVTTATGSPQGKVRFFMGATDLGTVDLPSSGANPQTAIKTFTDLPIGDYAITAVFEPTPASGLTANVSTTVVQHRYPSPRCVNDVCPGSH